MQYAIEKSFIIAVEIFERISASSHDAVEFLEVEHSITISISLFEHFLELVIGNLLSYLICDSLQIFEGDFVEVVLIEKFENLQDLIFGVSRSLNNSIIYHAGGHHSRKFIEVQSLLDLFSKFSVDITNVLLFDLHSESLHDGFEFSSIDLTYMI